MKSRSRRGICILLALICMWSTTIVSVANEPKDKGGFSEETAVVQETEPDELEMETMAVETEGEEIPMQTEAAADESMPKETTGEEWNSESASEESTPEESIPEESTTEESTTEESTAEESTTEESIPEESTPEGTSSIEDKENTESEANTEESAPKDDMWESNEASEGVAIEDEEAKRHFFNDKVSEKEEAYISECLRTRGVDITQGIKTEILYDKEDQPRFILGTGADGFLIYDRQTMVCLEGAEGSFSPYYGYEQYKKYYGGFLCYYVKESNTYLDLVEQKTVKEMGESTQLQVLKQGYSVQSEIEHSLDQNTDVYTPNLSAATVQQSKKIKNADQDIRGIAFGYNSSGTCTAVATQIILNYLDRNVNTSFVPSDMESEKLNGTGYLSTYVKAAKLHNYLTTDCKMGTATFGKGVSEGIQKYVMASNERSNLELYVEVTSPNCKSTLKGEIDAGNPTMMTTTLSLADTSCKWHTMVVYGYRETSDGETEFLVHRGWYGDKIVENVNSNYYETEYWINSSAASFAYAFKYEKNPMDLKAPSITSARANTSSISISWNSVSKADSYDIYRSTDGVNFEKVGTSTLALYTDNDVNKGVTYQYKIKATRKTGSAAVSFRINQG